MNPLLKAKFDRLEQCLGELDSALAQTLEQAQFERDKYEQLMQQRWRERKATLTSAPSHERVAELEEDNETLRSEREQVREHLRSIVAATRAISSEYRT